MASYNRVVMVGNLTRDPELRPVGAGTSVCRMSIASNRQFKNRQTGADTQEVCYVDVDVWGAQADSCSKYLKKGRPVLVEGRLKFDTWQDQQGATRSKHSIVAERVVFLGSANASDETSFGGAQADDFENTASSFGSEGTAEFDKIAAALSQKKASIKKKESSAPGAFKDEPPFEDELPF